MEFEYGPITCNKQYSPGISTGYDGNICQTFLSLDTQDPTFGTQVPTLNKAVRENIGMYFKVINSFDMAFFPFSRFSGLPIRYSCQNGG